MFCNVHFQTLYLDYKQFHDYSKHNAPQLMGNTDELKHSLNYIGLNVTTLYHIDCPIYLNLRGNILMLKYMYRYKKNGGHCKQVECLTCMAAPHTRVNVSH